MTEQRCIILNWNVRGLNSKARREVVSGLVQEHYCTIVCLQETKMEKMEESVVRETLGYQFARTFRYLPAQGTRGGILLAVHEDYYSISQHQLKTHTLSVQIQASTSAVNWWFTGVYGPQEDNEKLLFLNEIRIRKPQDSDNWLLLGDFNMIINPEDKSNNNLNRSIMGAFKSAIDDLEMKELQLKGRKFTWSNNETSTRIDRAFCTADWECMLPNCSLQDESSLTSYHCPLLIIAENNLKNYRGFRFESFWPKIRGFKEQVSEVWNKPVSLQNPFLRLHTKMQRTAKKLREWARSTIGNNKLLMAATKQLIGILDLVQEFRRLSDQEIALKRDLKN
ncbi:hypothetical protein SEVIR_9G232787v4 [Setaria viridis]|nr:uncharacterized protein LOC117838977 [Setaria viridis]